VQALRGHDTSPPSEPGIGKRQAPAHLSWIISNFGWAFVLIATGALVLCIVLVVHPWGRIRLGPDDSRPDFRTFSWVSMMFAAGLGAGLLFYGTAEPISHWSAPPHGLAEPQTEEAAKIALQYTYFHWGFNGWALYLLEGKPVFHYNLIGKYRSSIAGKDKLAPGHHVIVVDFKYDGKGLGKGGPVALTVDGKPAASGKLERTVPLLFSADETLDVGEDTGSPASEDYHVPFKFTGDLKKVMIELSDNKLTPAEEAEIRKAREAIGVVD